MTAAPFERWPWESRTVAVAAVDVDGRVLEANPAFRAAEGATGRGGIAALVVPEQHARLLPWLRELGGSWAQITVAVPSGPYGLAADRALWARREGDRLLVVLEPASGDADRFVDKLMTLNEDLVAAQRDLARALQRERRVGETLQRSLLPDRLPEVTGLELAARFRPATAAEVGGDWYDVIPHPDGSVVAVIGDVAGKGLAAASLMGEVRSVVRAYAFDRDRPSELLADTDRLVRRMAKMVTAAICVVDPRTGAMRQARAGHPPPVIVRADGSAELVHGGHGPPLLAYEPVQPDAESLLGPGDRLLLYTDGLIEHRDEPLDRALDRLTDEAGGRRRPLEELCDHLLEVLPPQQGRDDVALLAMERRAG